MRDETAAIAASVVKTTHRPGLFHQQRFLVYKQTSYTKHVLLALYNTCHHLLDVSQSEWHLGKVLLPTENE